MVDPSFQTVDGRSVPAVTADEMRAVDRVAVEEVELALLQMMENAGRNLAVSVREMVADGVPVVVLAGDGGNGGGGLAATRHLANHGTAVSVVLDRLPGQLTDAAATQYDILDSMSVPIGVGPEAMPADPPVVVDALVGYGLSGPLRGTAATMVESVPDETTVVSLDVPTGRDATSGAEPGPAVDPQRVVTLALPKTGLAGLDATLVLADIAIPAAVYDQLNITYEGSFGTDYLVELVEI